MIYIQIYIHIYVCNIYTYTYTHLFGYIWNAIDIPHPLSLYLHFCSAEYHGGKAHHLLKPPLKLWNTTPQNRTFKAMEKSKLCVFLCVWLCFPSIVPLHPENNLTWRSNIVEVDTKSLQSLNRFPFVLHSFVNHSTKEFLLFFLQRQTKYPYFFPRIGFYYI